MRLRSRLAGLALLTLALCALLALPAGAAGETYTTTVLFTHDLHSHFLPQSDGAGGETGGYARLMTALERERAEHPDALTLDAGDFSIGSLIQALYTTQAPELRTMGAMGYDATTAGNHEFDHEGTGFADMLTAAVSSGDRLPALLMANYAPAPDNPDALDIRRAMSAAGVREYMLLERGGVTYGIFGLMGEESHSYAPASGFALADPVQSAQRCVDALEAQGAQFIICLSHSGTDEKKKNSEDEQLAQAVEGIDLIVSGHSHTTLTQPILVEDTYIVSAGPYCQNLGSITLSWTAGGEKTLTDYRLIPIDETLPEDPGIAALVDQWKGQVDAAYLGRYGLTYDQVLTTSGFSLDTPASGVQEGNALGELVADAFLWTMEELDLAGDGPLVAVTADGVLRAPLPAGELTTSQAFDVLSMGVGEDGTSGYPLVSCYLTGEELRAVAEIDASVTPLMPEAQLYASGLEYSFNPHRMIFDRVFDASLYHASGGERFREPIDDDQLYQVVTGMYLAQMLTTVEEKSFGLISLTPKNADGQPVTDFSQYVVRDAGGGEIKEWYALAAYLQHFGADGLPDRYAQPDGRKDVSRSWNPVELVRSPGWPTLLALAALLLILAGAALLIRRIVRRRRRRRRGW